MPTFRERLQHGWNAFVNNRDPTIYQSEYVGFGYRPDKTRLMVTDKKTIVTAIYNQIAVDTAAISVRHVRVDENNRFVDYIKSHLDNVLSLEANIDQTGRALMQDIVLSMFDEGVVAVVPVDTTINPTVSSAFDILSLRTGKIVEWFPEAVKIDLYNEKTGKREDIVLPKKTVAIIENPLYAVMNSPNSTLKRLLRKLSLLDAVDEQSGAGKLDLIIQLPYTIKGETRKKQAEDRKKDIEVQLADSKYGIAYIDATEHITQLNRPVDNNLALQVEYLTNMLYNQLGLTKEIFEGTADEKVMLNYYNRTIEPILSAITDEMTRKFLSKTARTQRQAIKFFKDPFKLVPVSQIAEIADKFTRNEIMSPNEIRSLVGLKPSDDPAAEELRNRNINQQTGEEEMLPEEDYEEYPEEEPAQPENAGQVTIQEIMGG